MKKILFTLFLILGITSTVFAAPYFRQEAGLVPIEDSVHYLGTTTPSLKAWLRVIADSFYDTDASNGCAEWASNVLTSTGSSCGSGGGGGSDVNWTFFNTSGIRQSTSTNQVLIGATGATATTSLAKLEVRFDSAANGSLLTTGSTTLQNFTFVNATGTQATTTNLHISSLFNFGGDVFDELVGDGLDLSAGDLIFDCSDVAGTGITCSGEDITAEVLTAGDGLTKTALDLDCDTASGTVFGCLSSADWTTFNDKQAALGFTPANQATTITVAGTANQITSSAGAQDLSANRTWTLSLPNHVIFPSSYQAALGSTTNATSTNLTVTGNTILEQMTSALLLTSSGGLVSEYAGAGCTNQVVEDVSAVGATTCVSIESEQLGDDDWGDITILTGVASVEDDSHAHTGASLSGIDVSGDTNLTAGDNLTLTDDDLDLDTTLTNMTAATFSGLGTFGNLLATASSTFQNITFLNSTSTNATTTTLNTGFFTGAGLSECSDDGDTLAWNNGLFSCGDDDNSGGSGTPDTKWATSTGPFTNAIYPNSGNNNTLVGIGTSTPAWQLTISSSTRPQLALTDASLTSNIWTIRNAGGDLYLSTSSPSTFATSTGADLTVNNVGQVIIGNKGTNSLPALVGSGGLNNGLYFPNTVQVAIAANGTQRALFDITGLTVTGKGIFSGVVQLPNGTVSAPALAFTSTLNTGLYWDTGLSTIDFAVAGRDVFAVGASFAELVNATDDRAVLDADDLTADRTFTFPDQAGTICIVGVACDGSGSGSGNSKWATSTLPVSGIFNVGTYVSIGTSTPSLSPLTLSSSTQSQLTLTDGSLTSNQWSFRNAGGNFYLSTSSPSTFATSSNASILSLMSNSRVGISSTSPLSKLSIDVTGGEAITGLTINTGANVLSDFSIISSEAGSGGVTSFFYQNSATPAVNDVIGAIDFAGNDASGNSTPMNYMGRIESVITDTTTDDTAANLNLFAGRSGSYEKRLSLIGATNTVEIGSGSSGAILQSSGSRDLSIQTGGTSNILTLKDGSAYSGFGTTTPRWLLQLASSTRPQLTLSDASLTSNHWSFRNAGGILSFASSSPSTFATSSNSMFTLNSLTGTSTISSGNAATSSVYIYSTAASKGGSIILEDSDGAGCTEVMALNGTLSAITVTCPTEI